MRCCSCFDNTVRDCACRKASLWTLVTDCPEAPALWQRLRDEGLPDQYARLQDVKDAGRGLVAQAKIKKGEKILQVRRGPTLVFCCVIEVRIDTGIVRSCAEAARHG